MLSKTDISKKYFFVQYISACQDFDLVVKVNIAQVIYDRNTYIES